jgi:hypothetical protein
MTKQRTLREDARGFSLEVGKRRNLLNSAGSSARPGTLGYRVSQPRTRRATVAETVKGTPRLKRLNPPRRSIAAYLDFVERFPNVLALYRQRPTYARTVDVSLGAGRGW